MESSRKKRWQQLQAVFGPGFKQMLLVSVLLHFILPILYYSPFFPQREIEKPPVYRVNLVNKIVKNPQAGRPEATSVKKKPVVKKKPKPKPKPKPIPPKPKPKPKPPVKPKPVPVTPKVEPKVQPKPTVSKAQNNTLKQRLEQMRASQKKKDSDQARKDRIAALKAAALAESRQIESPVTDAPVGMVDGSGDEAGVSASAHVQEFIQQQWNLSKYQAVGNPEAEVKMFYSADGALIHYKFITKSGNSAFDESLTRAIVKSKQLDQKLPEAMEFHIFFNLKDMLDRP